MPIGLLSLFCIYMLLIPSLGNADIMGGHDTQRLNLLFLDRLHHYFAVQPIQINKSIFPVQVLSDDRQPILDVLSEEGGVLKTTDVKNISANSLNVTQISEYQLNPEAPDKTFILGYVKPESLVRVHSLPEQTHNVVRYQVTFTWSFVQPAEWIWAPVLDKNARILRLREASTHLQMSDATLIWAGDHWQVESANIF